MTTITTDSLHFYAEPCQRARVAAAINLAFSVASRRSSEPPSISTLQKFTLSTRIAELRPSELGEDCQNSPRDIARQDHGPGSDVNKISTLMSLIQADLDRSNSSLTALTAHAYMHPYLIKKGSEMRHMLLINDVNDRARDEYVAPYTHDPEHPYSSGTTEQAVV